MEIKCDQQITNKKNIMLKQVGGGQGLRWLFFKAFVFIFMCLGGSEGHIRWWNAGEGQNLAIHPCH